MRLLLITANYPSPVHPSRSPFNDCMVKALSRQNDVRVIAPISWVDELGSDARSALSADDGRRLNRDGVEVHHPRYFYPPKILRGQYGWFLWQSVRSTVAEVIASQRPQAVLGYWAHPDGEAAVRAAREAGVPAVVMVGGSDILMLAHNSVRRRRIQSVLHAADAVVATSNDLRDHLIKLGIPTQKIHVIYRGVDAERFSPGNRAEARARLGLSATSRIVLWVGRMVPVKGLDVLVRAASILRSRQSNVRVHLVGDGALRSQLEAEVAARQLQEHVQFESVQTSDRLADWYRAADLTVLPSRSEGIPNVLRESLACGTPFVASNVGGIPEIADPDMSALVPPGDPEAFAEAIDTMLKRSIAKGRSTHSMSWNESAEALMNVIRPMVLTR